MLPLAAFLEPVFQLFRLFLNLSSTLRVYCLPRLATQQLDETFDVTVKIVIDFIRRFSDKARKCIC